MTNEEMQVQIVELNRKVDLLLEYVIEQRQKSQRFDDLADDIYRVGNDAFKTAVKELDDNMLEIDMDQVKSLIFSFLKNVETFNTLLYMLQSATDFIKDASPIAKEMIIDFTYELERLNNEGLIDSLKTIIQNISNPDFVKSIANITTVVVNTKPDDKLDNKSMFKLLREMNKPEVRRGLSYGLRILKEISKQ